MAIDYQRKAWVTGDMTLNEMRRRLAIQAGESVIVTYEELTDGWHVYNASAVEAMHHPSAVCDVYFSRPRATPKGGDDGDRLDG